MVVRVPCGRWVATAGQVALDDEGHLVGPGDLEAQARQVFAHLNRALAAAGASFADVVKLNCYLTDITPLPAAVESYTELKTVLLRFTDEMM
jgi:enamine deaminase RidA (YjgF/YER057c/UK114 family)